MGRVGTVGLWRGSAAEKKVREPNIQYARKFIGAQRAVPYATQQQHTAEHIDVFG